MKIEPSNEQKKWKKHTHNPLIRHKKASQLVATEYSEIFHDSLNHLTRIMGR